MKKVESLRSFGNIKLLSGFPPPGYPAPPHGFPRHAHESRADPETVPGMIRHHILALESADLIEVSEIRKTGKVTEKFYRAKADAFFLQEMILPKTKKTAVIFSGQS